MKIDHDTLLSRKESEVSNGYYKLGRTYLRNIRNCSYYDNCCDDENVIVIVAIVVILIATIIIY